MVDAQEDIMTLKIQHQRRWKRILIIMYKDHQLEINKGIF